MTIVGLFLGLLKHLKHYVLLELLDSEQMIGHGTPIKDNTYISIPEKEFLIFIAYFSQNLHFFFHLNFEFPSMMDADLTLSWMQMLIIFCAACLCALRNLLQRSASIMEGNSNFE